MKPQVEFKNGFALVGRFIHTEYSKSFDYIIFTSDSASKCIDIANQMLKENSIKQFLVCNIPGKIVWSTYEDNINGYFENGKYIYSDVVTR